MGNLDDTAIIPNPKQRGSNVLDCRPQTGKCPLDCNQCFYNRPGAYYEDIDRARILDVEEVSPGQIVRVNCGHDSNLQRPLVVSVASKYPDRFFNTSIAHLDFPGPVVFTSNRKEEEGPGVLPDHWNYQLPPNLMFVRLRVSASNIHHIDKAVAEWTQVQVPIVLTFMAYYEDDAVPTRVCEDLIGINDIGECYIWKKRHINSYYCPTPAFIKAVMQRYQSNRLVTMCGTLLSNFCTDCRNCETYYWQTKKRLEGS